MTYTLTWFVAGGPPNGERVGRPYATVDDAKQAAHREARAHGRVILAWSADRAAPDEPAWAMATTTDGGERYLVEREVTTPPPPPPPPV